jgi:hypothetical protein
VTQNPPPEPPTKSIAQILSEDPALIDGLFLVTNGVPFDVAFSLDDDERLAWVVAVGRLKGREYNWHTRQWEPVR